MKKSVLLFVLVFFIISIPFSYSIDIEDVGDNVFEEFREDVSEGLTRYVYGSGLVASVRDSEISYYHSDRMQSNRLVTDLDGLVEKEFKSLPFGQEIENSGVRYAFATGKELDSSGLHYFGARYYDSDLGRFTSVDPVKENEPYSYVSNNPLYFVDPSGMEEEIQQDMNWFEKTTDFLFGWVQDSKQKTFNEEAVDFLGKRGIEGIRTTSYSLNKGKSGETVGIGYDLGQHTSSEIKRDFTQAGITDQKRIDIAIKYASDYIGNSISSGQLRLTKSESKKLSELVVQQIENHLINNLVGYSNLNEKEKIVMISFAYQYGSNGATRRFTGGSYLDNLIGNPSTLSERLNLGLKKMSTLQYKSRRNKEWNYAFGDSKDSLFNIFMKEWAEPFSESFLGN